MAKVIDTSASDGDLVIIGNSLVLPNSSQDSVPTPLNGAMRFNPNSLVAELFVNGTWETLSGSGGGGGGSPSVITISQVIGLVSVLANKAPLIHNHVISDITGLTAALAEKVDVGTTYGISNITGLTAALSAKSAIGHFHNVAEVEKISACLPGNPPGLFNLTWVATGPVSFPSNLNGSQFRVLQNPAALYVITLYKNTTTNLGTISITTSGGVSITIAPFTVVAGDVLTFSLPTHDANLSTLTLSVVGSATSENTSPSTS